MPGDEQGTFNLFQAVLLFVEKSSRGGKIAVPRNEFVRGLKRFFPGTSYNQLKEALRQLSNQGLIDLEQLGPDDFNARLTESGQELARKHSTPPAQVPPKPPSPTGGQPQARPPPARSPTPSPPSQARSPPDPSPASSPPPQAAPAVRSVGTPPPPAPRPAPHPAPAVQREPEAPVLSPEEEVQLSTFADVAPAASPHDSDSSAHDRRDMEDWLNQRLSAISDREETVMAKETQVFEREESLLSSEAAFAAKAEEIEKEVASVLERVMEELVRQEHLLNDRITSNPSRDPGLEDVLHKIKECEVKLEEMDKGRGPLRKMIRDVTGGQGRGARERGR